MELKSKNQLKVGDILSKPIYNSNGIILLPENTELTEKTIQKIKNISSSLQEQYFYINTMGTENIIIEDKISVKLRTETSKSIRNKNIDNLIDDSKKIVYEITKHNIHDVDYYDNRNEEDYIGRHSVNVAIVSCIIAKSMGFSYNELEEITLAGLLHDFSRAIDDNVEVRKNYEELLKCKKEQVLPFITYDLLKDTDYAKCGKISTVMLGSILYHHEHYNGEGYYKKKYDFVRKYKYASILHVADIYDTLINKDVKSIITDLPLNTLFLFEKSGGFTPKNIVSYFIRDCGLSESQRLFDSKVINHFIKCVSVYSKGRRVILSNGDIAVVKENSGRYSDRPEVVVIEGEHKGKTIDLSKDMNGLNLVVDDYDYSCSNVNNLLKK